LYLIDDIDYTLAVNERQQKMVAIIVDEANSFLIGGKSKELRKQLLKKARYQQRDLPGSMSFIYSFIRVYFSVIYNLRSYLAVSHSQSSRTVYQSWNNV